MFGYGEQGGEELKEDSDVSNRPLGGWRCYQHKMEHGRSRFRNAVDEFSFVYSEFYTPVVLSGKDVLQTVGKVRLQLKREGDLRLEN